MSALWHPHLTHTGSSAGTPGFSSLFRMLDDFDRYTSQLSNTGTSTSVSTFTPRFDVAEHEKEYVLQGELPGVPPSNVEIEFTDDQTLVVRGRSERKHTEGDPALLESGSGAEQKKTEGGADKKKGDESSKTKPRYWLSERSYGEFSRVFTFPNPVDQDKVQAKFKDGVLDITVPKAEKKSARRITIQ
ncbi:30 kDa heat shock protein [Corynascus novoguineensis]|uniref:30 kDa heat shock protein n=1 Tax=Corynascus novoguineensis TaxID=1126955 RepID=A0AAN7CTS4_9PEZI|nr:30 kDa heat shock protein [Corynascus novoguineensis]